MLKLFLNKFWEYWGKVGVSLTVVAIIAIALKEITTLNPKILLILGIILITLSSLILTLTEKE
jgi:hypothetical protein